MKNSFNNLLSFLVTSMLIFMLAFIMMTSFIEIYRNAERDIKEIEEARKERDEEIDGFLDELEDIEGQYGGGSRDD